MHSHISGDTPINEDPECLKFIKNTPENLLLDKVIQREIQQID